MGSINLAFGIIAGALDADQEALSVVANNVANASTTGYARETPNWRENPSVEINGIAVGTGVTETGATSQRDRVLEERLDQQQQLSSASSTRLSALNSMQSLFLVDSGSSSSTAGDIGSDITKFFNSFSSLEADPTSNSLREQVLSSATTLAGDISGKASSLNTQRSSLDGEAAGVEGQVNALTKSIAQLNLAIQSAAPDADAGGLEDERQQDLSQLSQLIGINQVTTEGNGLSITTTSGQLLVSAGQSFQMTTGTVNGVTDFFLGGQDITSGLTLGGGQLGGYLTARDRDIPSVLNSLDQLAYGISTAVNAQNNIGSDANGTSGTAANPLNIFAAPTQVAGSAAAMSVVMTDPSEIAAAAAGAGAGDNSNATAMAVLASASVVNGQPAINFYSSFVSNLGSMVSEVQTEDTANSASVTQLQTQRDALSGVNQNEEASMMAQLETSYQAASQVFNILNTIIASALNLGEQTTVS
jgi:flagellar hook-associated protein 1 FlgK